MNTKNIDYALYPAITGDMLLSTDQGLQFIDYLAGYIDEGEYSPFPNSIEILSDDMFSIEQPKGFIGTGNRSIYKIILENGMSIKGTYNLLLLVKNGTGKRKYETIENITDKHYLIIPKINGIEKVPNKALPQKEEIKYEQMFLSVNSIPSWLLESDETEINKFLHALFSYKKNDNEKQSETKIIVDNKNNVELIISNLSEPLLSRIQLMLLHFYGITTKIQKDNLHIKNEQLLNLNNQTNILNIITEKQINITKKQMKDLLATYNSEEKGAKSSISYCESKVKEIISDGRDKTYTILYDKPEHSFIINGLISTGMLQKQI